MALVKDIAEAIQNLDGDELAELSKVLPNPKML